jgi:hypothetical protein
LLDPVQPSSWRATPSYSIRLQQLPSTSGSSILYPQPGYVPCHGGKDPLNIVTFLTVFHNNVSVALFNYSKPHTVPWLPWLPLLLWLNNGSNYWDTLLHSNLYSLSILDIHRHSSCHTTYVIVAIMSSGFTVVSKHHYCTLGRSDPNMIPSHCCTCVFNNVFGQLFLTCSEVPLLHNWHFRSHCCSIMGSNNGFVCSPTVVN